MSNSTHIPWLEFFHQDNWYSDLFIKYGDPRTTDGYWLKTPEPMMAAVILYLVFVVVVPRLMENRPPMGLKSLIIIYNFLLVGISGYMCVEFFLTSTLMGYSYLCQPVDWSYPTDPLNTRMVNVNWLFFFSKIIELADTVFFILRKKNSQVSFLHVYHHSTMIINWWMAAKYVPIGQSFFVGMVNSFIHTLMYVYYGLAAIGPSMQKYLWWKRYMTKLQLAQFVAIVSHTGYNMFIRTDCDYPWLFNAITFYYTWSMLFLFLHFYYTTYVASKHRRATKKVSSELAEAAAKNEVSAGEPDSDGKSPYMNGYIANSPTGYGLRSRKNGSINGNTAAVADASLN